ncbi:MAG: DUF3795 domain-containing protein [Patescibacteria group bacterium]
MPYSSVLQLKNLASDKPSVKYCTAKRAVELSKEKPRALYPKLGVFVPFLDGDNRIFKWTAIIIIGNLAIVDKNNRIGRLVPKLISFLHGQELITAANSIKALGLIAQAKPRFKEKIFTELIAVEKARYYNKGKVSPECRNVALGHVLSTFEAFPQDIARQKDLQAFIKRQLKNRRPAVREAAKKLLQLINKPPASKNFISDRGLIAPCGMNCGLCAAYLREKKKCPGCRGGSKDKSPACINCRIKNCPKLEKAKAAFCFACGSFPCDRVKHLDARYQAHYHMSMIENLKYIEDKGIDAFLRSQKKKWQCPTCGRMICCHNGLCYKCDIMKLKAKKRKYRWEE